MNIRSLFVLAMSLLLGMPAMAGDPHDDSAPVTQAGAWSDSSSTSQAAAVAGAASLSASNSSATGGTSVSGANSTSQGGTGGNAVSASQGGAGGTSAATSTGVAGNIENRQNASSVTSIGDVSATSGASSAKIGDTTATGGASSAKTGDSSAQANGGAQTTVVAVQGDSYEQIRQAPSVAQGSIVIQTCSAGGNAGGSNTSGSAFLGFGYITGSCYDLSYAAAYAALGQRQAACDILRTSKRGKKYEKRGVTLPAICAEPSIVVPDTITRAEVNQRIDRAIKAMVSK